MSEWSQEEITETEPQRGLIYGAQADELDEDARALLESVEQLREEVRRSLAAHNLALEREEAAAEHARLTAARLFQAQQRLSAGLERDLEDARRRAPVGERSLPTLEANLDIRPIVEGLMSTKSATRVDARQRFNELGFSAVGPLLKLIQREGVRRERRIALAASVAVFAIVFAFGLFIFNPMMLPDGKMAAVNIGILVVLGVLLFSTGPSKIQKKSAQLLADFDDPRLIGPLADSLENTDGYTSRVAAAGLKRMLPRVRASDAPLIPLESLAVLYRMLNGRDADLTIAVLRSLEQIGDEKAFPFVEKLAEMNPTSLSQRRVKKAAAECLPALLERTRKGAVSQTLLRAATSPESASDSLLRPVATTGEADPMELLRAVDPDG